MDVCFWQVCLSSRKSEWECLSDFPSQGLRERFWLVGFCCCHLQCALRDTFSLFYTLSISLFRLAFVCTIYVCLCTCIYKIIYLYEWLICLFTLISVYYSQQPFMGIPWLTFAQDAWKLENCITYNLAFEKIAAIFAFTLKQRQMLPGFKHVITINRHISKSFFKRGIFCLLDTLKTFSRNSWIRVAFNCQ